MLDDFPSNQRLGHGDDETVDLQTDTTTNTANLDLLSENHSEIVHSASNSKYNNSNSNISLSTNSNNSASSSSLASSSSNGDNNNLNTTNLSFSQPQAQPSSSQSQVSHHQHHYQQHLNQLQPDDQKLRLSSHQYIASSSSDPRSSSYNNIAEVNTNSPISLPTSISSSHLHDFNLVHHQQPYSLLDYSGSNIVGASKLLSDHPPLGVGSINASFINNQHDNMIPSTHSLDQANSIHHYQLPTTKPGSNLAHTSAPPLEMSLNVSSQDLLQHNTNHHNLAEMHPHTTSTTNTDSLDLKPPLSAPSNTFDQLGAASGLMQPSSAVGMTNIWKNSMSLNQFKPPNLAEHSFSTNPEINSFPSWSHSNNLSHQSSASMTHHLLDGQHLIGYPHHRRSLPTIGGQDLVGISMKNQPHADHTSFKLNSINHQASTSQTSTSSSHQTTQSLDNLNLRSHPLDYGAASYGLAMNDNHQFYNNSRSSSDSRSHPSAIKSSSFMTPERPTHHMASLSHQNQLSYHNAESATISGLQATTSGPLAGSSTGVTVSRNMGNFRCPTCNEVFSLRTTYQSHLKTHSQDKGTKAKFSCNLCGHKFSQKTSLNRHMKSHTGERPFPCEICAKAFSEKERLKIHMRTHTGEKPFSCSICGKSFSQKSTVKRHQTVHTGEKKFKCDCGKGFANRGNLIAHIKTRGSNHFE